jgi:hypothetical protein
MKVRLFDEIAENIVHGEKNEREEDKHASLLSLGGLGEKVIRNKFIVELIKMVAAKADDYKVSSTALVKGYKKVGDIARLARIAKAGKIAKPSKEDKEVGLGIAQKMERTSVLVPPGDNDWYDFRYMLLIAGRFRKVIKKIVRRKLYSSTVMNSAPHGTKHLRNFGDVIVQLKPGFAKDENWVQLKSKVASVIHEFEQKYPGLNFVITHEGNARHVVVLNSGRYQYPGKMEPIFLYDVDPLVSWF